MNNRRKNPIRIEELRRQIIRLEVGRQCDHDTPVQSGCGPLDRLLPERGFRRGTLIEWLTVGRGSGAETLALRTAVQACRDGAAMVVLDRQRQFYPPAAARLGIELQNLIVVYATGDADNAWALDQAIRCPGVAAVLAWPEKLDGRSFRRLQLAAEQSGVLGLLIRPLATRYEPSWADVRLLVEPLPGISPGISPGGCKRRLRIHLLRCRGASDGRSIDVEIDDETHTVHLDSRLAVATARRRPVRA